MATTVYLLMRSDTALTLPFTNVSPLTLDALTLQTASSQSTKGTKSTYSQRTLLDLILIRVLFKKSDVVSPHISPTTTLPQKSPDHDQRAALQIRYVSTAKRLILLAVLMSFPIKDTWHYATKGRPRSTHFETEAWLYRPLGGRRRRTPWANHAYSKQE